MNAITALVLPRVGEWYLDSESEDEFEVVDVDEELGTVEIQYFDGDVAEFSLEEWNSRELSRIEAPEDWTGPLDKPEEGDTGYDQESFELPPKHKPLAGYEQDEVLLADEAEAHEELLGSEPEDG